MSKRTELYLNGMQAVNNFFEMLYAAMLEAMPRVLLSNSGVSVKGAASTVGYKSEAAFSRSFRRFFGFPPVSASSGST